MKIFSLSRAVLLALTLGMALAKAATAAVIANDTFSYPTAAPLETNNGGAGWGGAWGATENPATLATVINSSGNPLEYLPSGGALISGGTEALEIKLTDAGTGNHRAGARPLATPLTSTFYAGYLFRYDGSDFAGGNNTFTLHFSDSATNNAGSINFGGRGGTTDANLALQEFVVRSGTGVPVPTAIGGGDLVNGQEYYLVAKLIYSAANTFDAAEVWINPSAIDPTPDLTLSLPAGTGRASMTHAYFRQAANQNATGPGGLDIFVVDGLVIGETWEDVVGRPIPEPSTLLLAATGIAASLWRRRS